MDHVVISKNFGEIMTIDPHKYYGDLEKTILRLIRKGAVHAEKGLANGYNNQW